MTGFDESDNTFKLIVRDRPVAGYPEPGDIRWRLQMLTDETDTFVLLKSPGHYMQCAGTADGGFRVEYREGTADRHYVTAGGAVDLDVTANLFISYLCGDERWRELVAWAPTGVKQAKGRSFRLIDRRGNTVVINRKWCLIGIGALLNVIGAGTFFLLREVTHLYMSWVPGSIIALGVVCLVVSGMGED